MKTPAMKLGLLVTLLCLPCASRAEDAGPALLHSAAYCLNVKHFLPRTKTAKLTFGYLLDENSYPGTKVLYVVNYPDSARPNGFVFTVVLTEHASRQDFNIQNNARFTMGTRGNERISFVDPPLGGTWTHEHLAHAIKVIEKQTRVAISVKSLLVEDPSVTCEAYSDPQIKPSSR